MRTQLTYLNTRCPTPFKRVGSSHASQPRFICRPVHPLSLFFSFSSSSVFSAKLVRCHHKVWRTFVPSTWLSICASWLFRGWMFWIILHPERNEACSQFIHSLLDFGRDVHCGYVVQVKRPRSSSFLQQLAGVISHRCKVDFVTNGLRISIKTI